MPRNKTKSDSMPKGLHGKTGDKAQGYNPDKDKLIRARRKRSFESQIKEDISRAEDEALELLSQQKDDQPSELASSSRYGLFATSDTGTSRTVSQHISEESQAGAKPSQ